MKEIDLMQQALQLAARRRGFCAPNPAVGAVVVKNGEIIAEGMHWACGHAHAEAAALQPLKEQAAGATLYVTLEPCSHYGRTPPCTELIIRSKIREVVYGAEDPNPKVKGEGAKILQKAGVHCRQLATPAVEEFYHSYRYWLQHQRPIVTAKLALSLDGKIAGPNGGPLAMTGAECQRFTHQQRKHSDAILTTAATVIADNPQLNVRLDNETIAKPLYILDSQLRLPTNVRILQTTKSITVFHDFSASSEQRERLIAAGIRCIEVNADAQGLNLTEILDAIGKDGHHDLWVEAGGRCFSAFINAGLAQRAFLYIAPKILGEAATNAFPKPFQFPNHAKITWQPSGLDTIATINF